jgi:uncharacterized protein YjbI with pentapeptide repeats
MKWETIKTVPLYQQITAGRFIMKTQKIISSHNGRTLYEGSFESFKHCLEQGVIDRANLAGANLKNYNLSNACLDDGLLTGADFSGCNLTGANLSEARLRGALFCGADLYNTCLAYADVKSCDFTDAMFGATDITGADISNALFSTLSCFTLDFPSAASLQNCRFTNDAGQEFFWSRPPVVIRGLGLKPVIFTDQCWMHGTAIMPYPEQFHPIGYLAKMLPATG